MGRKNHWKKQKEKKKLKRANGNGNNTHSRDQLDPRTLVHVKNESAVDVFMINGTGTVFDANDAFTLRRKWRIVGAQVGSMPIHPSQNQFLSSPLLLLPEEVRLGVEKGFMRIWDDSEPFEWTKEEMEKVEQVRLDEDQLYFHLHMGAEKKKIAEASRNRLRNLVNGDKGKGKAKNKRKREEMEQDQDEDEDEDEDEEEKQAKQELKKRKTEEILEWKQERLDELDKKECSREFLDSVRFYRVPNEVEYPLDPLAHCKPATLPELKEDNDDIKYLRYRIFKDCWERGLSMTSGSKFGGDFLVYPADPVRFHSHFLVICFPFEKKISTLDIVSSGRLGTSVAKSANMGTVDNNGKVLYLANEWLGGL